MNDIEVLVPETSPEAWEQQLAEFRKSRLKLFPLARTGIVIQYEPAVSLFFLAKAGRIPDTLSATVAQFINGGGGIKPNLEDFGNMLQLTEILLKLAVKWPPLVEGEGTDGALGLDEIHDQDKLEFFNQINKGAEELKPFRRKVGRESAAAALTGESLREVAEPDPEDPGRVDSVSTGPGDVAGRDTLGSGGGEEEQVEIVIEGQGQERSATDTVELEQPA
jgi:hypothetical protein